MSREISFERLEYRIGDAAISYLDSGGKKPLLHFFHANGFPSGTYLPLLTDLAAQFRVVGLSLPGQDGLGGQGRSWNTIAADLAGFLDSLGSGPVIGVGHSIGAVTTMICAVNRPELFSRIIMLDPVMIPLKMILLFRLLKRFHLMDRVPLVHRSRHRRNGWKTQEDALEYFSGRKLFQGWDERFFQAYLRYGLKPGPDGAGLVLVCPPEVESEGFKGYPLDVWSWPRQIQTPVFLVRGESSFELSKNSFARFQKDCPALVKGRVVAGAGHCFPMQKSKETAGLIEEFCL